MIVVKAVAQWTRRQIAAVGNELGDPFTRQRPAGSGGGTPRAEWSMRRWRHRPGRLASDEGRDSR